VSDTGEVRYGTTAIRYRVSRSTRRRKTVEITVESPGQVLVAAPIDTSTAQIEAILRRRAGRLIHHHPPGAPRPSGKRFVSGESLPYLGRAVPLTVRRSPGMNVRVDFDHWHFTIRVPKSLQDEPRRLAIREALETWYRERAAVKLPQRVARIASLLGNQPKAVLVRGQRARWASCGKDGTLRFNWRVIMAPPALVDYIIAHELAHLRVQHHSDEYWALVSSAIPDFRIRRTRLLEIGPSLTEALS